MPDEPRQTYVIGQVIDIEFPNGETAIVQRIIIDCPGCGRGLIDIAGHHLRQVYEVIGRTIEALPEKCGGETTTHYQVDPERVKKARDN